MNSPETWRQIYRERRELHNYLSQLPEDKWRLKSTRTGWTVKQLTAHIILESNYTMPLIAKHIFRARFNTNKLMDLAARHFAESHSIPRMLGELRANISNHRLPPGGITAQEALIDLWIHAVDIKEATKEPYSLPSIKMEAIIDFVHDNPNSRGLKVMGIPSKLKADTYILTDYKNLRLGSGSRQHKLTKRELFKELISLE